MQNGDNFAQVMCYYDDIRTNRTYLMAPVNRTLAPYLWRRVFILYYCVEKSSYNNSSSINDVCCLLYDATAHTIIQINTYITLPNAANGYLPTPLTIAYVNKSVAE